MSDWCGSSCCTFSDVKYNNNNNVFMKMGCPYCPPRFSDGQNLPNKINRCVSKNVFVGVVSAESRLSNYVGSDRSGWGYLANKAIWHNKGKVRNVVVDYFPQECSHHEDTMKIPRGYHEDARDDRGTTALFGENVSDWGDPQLNTFGFLR